jgi:hypothetical protein
MPNADLRRELPRRRNSGSPTPENSENANFGERRQSEVRRTPRLSTQVNGAVLIANSTLTASLHKSRSGEIKRTDRFSEKNSNEWGVPSRTPKLRPRHFKDLGAAVGQ